jgi:hypothetical protein
MTARPKIGPSKRRARVGMRHRLAPGTQVASVQDAAAAMVVLHATDQASLFMQARARMERSSSTAIEHAIYEERSVLRILAMRRTLFLAPLADVALIHAAASRAVSVTERRQTIKLIAEAGVTPDPASWFEELERVALAAIRERGELSTAELTALDPRLAQKITMAPGSRWERAMSVSQKVAFHLALDGRIGRTRPRGTWVASQFRWSPIERWLPDGIDELPVDGARAELVRRWLRTFGPGTRNDIQWWTGWTVGAVQRALAAIDAVEVDLDGGRTGYLLAGDVDSVESPEPWIALLPALDATTMGWTDRDWYLGPYRPMVFDSAGNGGPTVWADGRIVGSWTQPRTGEIEHWLFEDIGVEARNRIDEEAASLAEWLGPARVRGSFPQPGRQARD